MCRGLSCILLSVFNIVLMVAGIALAVIGGLLKWNKAFLENITNKTLETLASKLTDDATGMIDQALTVLQEFSGPIGLAIFIIGIILIIFAGLGFIGACCEVKCFLIIYAAVLGAIVLAHIILIIVYFADKNLILNPLRKLLKDAVDNYESVQSGTPASMFLSILMPALECCGYNNGEDFKASTKFQTTDTIKNIPFTNLKYPVPCCILNNISDQPGHCPRTFTPTNSYIEKGCLALSEKDLVELVDKVALYSLIPMAVMVLVLIGSIILIRKKN